MAGVSDLDKQIIQLAAYGYSNEEIGKMVYRSERTVEKRIKNIRIILDVESRVTMILKALSRGLIKNPFATVERPKF